MKRFGLILISAFAAIALVWVTNRQKFEQLTASPPPVLVENRAIDQEGTEIAGLSTPADPGERRQIAELMQLIADKDESEWSRSFVLTSSDGSEVSTEDLKGQPYIANFFFSTCPASCKQQTDQVKLLQQKYKDQPIRFISITVHPDVDTPDVLSAYADAAGAIPGKWLFLTGDMKQISKAGNDVFLLGAIRERAHPDRLCLVNANGTLVGKYNWHMPDEVLALNEHVQELLGSD